MLMATALARGVLKQYTKDIVFFRPATYSSKWVGLSSTKNNIIQCTICIMDTCNLELFQKALLLVEFQQWSSETAGSKLTPNWLMSFFASQDLLLQEKARKDADKAKHSALALGWSKSCGRVLCVVVALLGNLAWFKTRFHSYGFHTE